MNKELAVDRESLKEYVKSKLGEKRFAHSVYTAEEAVKLANRYGADENKAYVAGMLHDVAKGIPADKLLKTAHEKGISIDKYENDNPELIHGKVSAFLAKSELGITDKDILSAIELHTTGSKKMSLLEKIIYIADLIEPGRTFEGLIDIRKLAYCDLDGAMKLALESVIHFVKSNGLTLHPDSVEAYEYLDRSEDEY